MERMFLSIFLLTAVTFTTCGSAFAAEVTVDVLQGKVQTIIAKNKLTIFLLDRDGSILDLTAPDSNGNFKLDVTIMDDPLYKNLVKLKVRISEKKGVVKEFKIIDNIAESIGSKVTLRPLNFP
jgi:hypothetical protein